MSDLLQTPEMRAIKAAGGLVGDKEVISLLFRRLVRPEYRDGVLVDGFPRTAGQVACLKLLKKKLDALHAAEPEKFAKPSFNILMLFVTEHESVERQLKRGREMQAKGLPVRETDVDPAAPAGIAQGRVPVFPHRQRRDDRGNFRVHPADAFRALNGKRRSRPTEKAAFPRRERGFFFSPLSARRVSIFRIRRRERPRERSAAKKNRFRAERLLLSDIFAV